MRILIVSDAWSPQVNGVVVTLKATIEHLRARGEVVDVIEPGLFRTVPCPTYPEIRLSWRPRRLVMQRIAAFSPDVVHIATEGPLGLAARRAAARRNSASPLSSKLITRASRSTSKPASAFHWPGLTPTYAGFTTPRG